MALDSDQLEWRPDPTAQAHALDGIRMSIDHKPFFLLEFDMSVALLQEWRRIFGEVATTQMVRMMCEGHLLNSPLVGDYFRYRAGSLAGRQINLGLRNPKSGEESA